MNIFLLVIAIVGLILDFWFMSKEYEKQNLVGVVYYGIMMLMLAIALN